MDVHIETNRLLIVPFTLEDAPFIFRLLNDPLWIAGIGDRNIKTLEDAENYLRNGPLSMYSKHGFGPFKVILKTENIPIGMCGLFKRDTLKDVDIGFAFLEAYCGMGYGKESSLAIMDFAKNQVNVCRLVAIVSPSNLRSRSLLKSLHFREEELIVLDGKDTILLSFVWN
jgi:RimJ/RimL family protein N-acetyltransferase